MKQESRQSVQKNIMKGEDQDSKKLSLNFGYGKCWFEMILKRDSSMLERLQLHSDINHNNIKLLINFNWVNLKQLNLCYNQIGNRGVKFVAKMDLPNLKDLFLFECFIGEEGIKHLTKGKWPNLTTLELRTSSKDKTDNTIMFNSTEVIPHNHWKKLQHINAHQVQPICLINCILLEAKYIPFYFNHEVQNQIHDSIFSIFIKRYIGPKSRQK